MWNLREPSFEALFPWHCSLAPAQIILQWLKYVFPSLPHTDSSTLTQHLSHVIIIDEVEIYIHIQTFPYKVLAVCIWHWSQVSWTSSSVQSVGQSSQMFGLLNAVYPDVRNASRNICVWIIAVNFASFYLLCLLCYSHWITAVLYL